MEFVNPGFLYGLLAVSIPVIIHLFNFRRFKKVYFTNVAFIRELKQETQKQSRLKHLLILLMRMLAIAALVLAFARPFIPAENAMINPDSQNIISIYIDNSFSMQAESDQGMLLDAARTRAVEIASVYGSADRFQLLTNEFKGSGQRFLSRDEFLEALDEVKINPATRTLPEVIRRQDQILGTESRGNKTAYILSDFQENMMQPSLPEVDTLSRFFMVPFQAVNADNLYIDSCWFEAPVQQRNQSSDLHVRFRNSSSGDYERVPVKLMINDQQKALASLDIAAGKEEEVVLTFTSSQPGIHYGEISITDYPITFDDRLYFTFPVSEKVSILCINGDGPNGYLNALFSSDTGFYYRTMPEQGLNYSELPEFNMIILSELQSVSSGMRQELTRFVENGGSLVVLPGTGIDLAAYNELLAALSAGRYGSLDTMDVNINRINLDHALYKGVFEEIPENINLPRVLEHYPIRVGSQQIHDKLLELENGDIFLNVQPYGQGRVYVFAVPIATSFSNFPRHALFVPTLYNMAISSVTDPPLYNTIGRDEMIRVNRFRLPGDEVVTVRARQGAFDFIPEQKKINAGLEIYPRGQITEAGFYELVFDESIISGLAFNYDRLESEMRFAETESLQKYAEDSGIRGLQVLDTENQPFVQALTDLSRGKQLWRWFVFATLFFLLMETVLLRWWK
ncbi:MAG: BatA domain-containing protein [Bacteroidetes bacterium]|nr:BatA domain-containing protein [Bacteroidota bacterium]